MKNALFLKFNSTQFNWTHFQLHLSNTEQTFTFIDSIQMYTLNLATTWGCAWSHALQFSLNFFLHFCNKFHCSTVFLKEKKLIVFCSLWHFFVILIFCDSNFQKVLQKCTLLCGLICCISFHFIDAFLKHLFTLQWKVLQI